MDGAVAGEVSFTANLVEEHSHRRTGALLFTKKFHNCYVRLRLRQSRQAFDLVTGPFGCARDDEKCYSFNKDDLKVYSRFMHEGKMT